MVISCDWHVIVAGMSLSFSWELISVCVLHVYGDTGSPKLS